MSWRLKLLGTFSLSDAASGESHSIGRFDRALIGYLALAPEARAVRVDLATLLWGDKLDSTAQNSLKDSVWRIRRKLGPKGKEVLKTEGDYLSLDLSQFSIDVLELKELAQQTDRQSLEQAVQLYQGDFLEHSRISTSDFEHWVTEQRESLRFIIAEVLTRLAVKRAEAGEVEAAASAAEGALQQNEFYEPAYCVLLQANLQLGRRALALKQATACEEVFQAAKLDLSPSTREAIARLRSANTSLELPFPPFESSAEAVSDAELSEPDPVEHTANSTRVRASVLQRLLWWGTAVIFAAPLLYFLVLGIDFWRIPELAPAPFGAWLLEIKRNLQAEPPSLAVLPFWSHGDADSGDYADAITEGVASALAIASDIRVVPSTSVSAAASDRSGPQGLAKALGVRYLLEGTVIKSGSMIRVQISLIDTLKTAERKLTETYEREGTDIISLQKQITLEVITSLRVSLTTGQQEHIERSHSTNDLESWLASARGERLLGYLTPGNVILARRQFEAARRHDPENPASWSGLAWTHLLEARFGWTASPEDSLKQAASHAEVAYEIDPERPQTLSLLGTMNLAQGRFDEAVKMGETALQIDPNNGDAAMLLAYTLTFTGEPNRAIALAKRAIRQRPYTPNWYNWVLGRAYRVAGYAEEAVALLSRTPISDDTSVLLLIELVAAFSDAGQIKETRFLASKVLERWPSFTVSSWLDRQPYSDSDHRERERAALRRAGLP